MKNLAGNRECDVEIRRELTSCGIEIVELPEPRRGEVPARLTGRIGRFTFTRAWYYWVVQGSMPLARARTLYDNPVGRTDIRVEGHCGCPAPEHDVASYHIDSELGLHIFAMMARDLEGLPWPSEPPTGSQET
jgi:hypothetical protein